MAEKENNKKSKEEKSVEAEIKAKAKKRKADTQKALKTVKEINNILDKMILNKEITRTLPIKSTQLKPFKK